MNIHASDFDPHRPTAGTTGSGENDMAMLYSQQQQQQQHQLYGNEDYYNSTDEYASAQQTQQLQQTQPYNGEGEPYHQHDNYSYDPQQQQQQQEDQGQHAYYNQNAEAFVPQQQQQQQHYEQQPPPYGEVDASTNMYGVPHNSNSMEMDPGGGVVDPEPIPGTYYPTAAYPASDQGTPISALAWTELPTSTTTTSLSAAAAATESVLQVAFHTQTTSSKKKSSRASYLSTHVVDAMDGSFLYLYSSVAAHPEASSDVLHRLFHHDTAHSNNTNTSRHNHKAARIPSHAYQPPFSAPASTTTTATTAPHLFLDHPKCYMGIHTLLPFMGVNGQHFTATASPSG
eukprot:scaffold317205_cov50-Attheya_sp.AAC.1